MAKVGTGYVDVRGDLSSLNRQIVAAFAPARLGGMGKKAGLAVGAGLGAGLVAAGVGKGLFDLGAKFDTEFDKIRVGTGKTGKALDGLEGDFKDVVKSIPTDFGSAGTAISGLASRLNLTGEPLQKLTRQVLQLSRITGTDVGENVEAVTRLFGDWSISTERQSTALDRLFRIQQRTGLSVSKNARLLVQFGAPLRQLGFDFDEAAVMFGKFEKEGVNLQTILPGFRFGLKNLSKPTGEAAATLDKLGISAKDPKVALQELFAAIKDAPSDLEATGIASAVFGRRAGSDMAAAVREGRFEYDGLIKSIKGGGDTIGRAEENTRDFAEQWDLLKNRIFVGLEPLANKVFDTIGDGMEKLATADFGAIGGDISTSLNLGSVDLSGAAESIRSSVKSIKSIVQSEFAQLLGEGLLGTLKKQVAGVGQIFRGMGQVIGGTLKLIDDLIHLRFGKAFGDLGQIVKGGVNIAIGALRLFTAPVREIAAQVGRALLRPLRSAWQDIKGVFSSGVGGALGILRGMIGKAADLGGSIGKAVVRGLKGALRGAGSAIVGGLNFAGDFAKAIGRKIAGLLNDAIPNSLGPINLPDNPIKGFAKGGKAHGWAVVGEEGPELAHFSRPTDIVSNPLSKKMARRMGVPGFAKGTVAGNKKAKELVYPLEKRGRIIGTPYAGTHTLGNWQSDNAIDVGVPVGTAVLAVKPGRIAKTGGKAGGGGRFAGLNVTLTDGNSFFYTHLSSLKVRGGEQVALGDVLGKSGSANGVPHLHLGQEHGSPLGLRGAPIFRKALQQVSTKKRQTLAGRTLSLGQMVTLAKRVGFPDPALAAAVGYAESRGVVGVAGDGGDSLGLWQINTPAHPRYDENKLQKDAFYNARAALAISKGGKTFQPWTQYRNAAYKQFLRAKAAPLPKGTSKIPTGSKYTDYLEMKAYDATGTPSLRDDYKWINRAMRYWRGVIKRNRRAGNFARVNEARGELDTWREKKKALRTPAEDEALEDAYTLGGLSEIGTGPNRFRIGGMQRVLDQIDLEAAQASLTIPADSDDSIGALSASLQDDIAAASKLVSIRDSLYKLTQGFRMPGRKLDGPFDPTPAQTRALNKTKNQTERITLLRKFIAEATQGPWIEGTIKQKIEAATDLATARSQLKDFTDQAGGPKEETVPEEDTKKRDILSFTTAISDLLRDFGSNIRFLKNVPSFKGGGWVKAPIGQPVPATVHGGELIVDPNTGKTLDMREFVGQLVEAMRQNPAATGKQVIQNNEIHYAAPDPEPHTLTRSLLHELKAAV